MGRIDEQGLLQALAIDDYTSRRSALRKQCQTVLKRAHLSTNQIERAYDMSPMVGLGDNQIRPRMTISGLRDALDESTQIALIAGVIDVADVIGAIADPKHDGVPKPSSSSARTDWVFGRPKKLDLADLQTHIHALKQKYTTTNGDETMSDFFLGLNDCMNVIDNVVARDPAFTDIDDVLRTARKLYSDFPVDAVRSAFSLRDKPVGQDEVGMTDDASLVFNAIVAEMFPEPTAEEPEAKGYAKPDAGKAQLIDLTLAQAGLPPISQMIDELNQATQAVKDAEARAASAMTCVNVGGEQAEASGEIPSGKVTVAKAYDVFGLTRGKAGFDFDVPVWDWNGEHPHVPEVDGDYVFRPFELMRVLYALITNQRAYLHGHTGSGKTTLVEQVAARLCWPFMRVNFDSEITRMDLIGRDVLANENGVTTSRFVDGILPQMMSGPYIGCFDELDFVRPDVAYVMQRAFEGNGLLLTEDGGRMVKPNRMFRAFATGNTVGQGDEHGMYQGARPQSLALLDRFTVWVHVDYMSAADRRKLIKARCTSLSEAMVSKLDQYVGEHLEAFKTSKVLQPISPRSYLALGNAIATFTAYFPAGKEQHAIEQAIETTILDRATAQDRAVLKGIADRVFA